ncbi:MAG: ankyrin repeat domain-containing protein [Burkholderiales bacterium]
MNLILRGSVALACALFIPAAVDAASVELIAADRPKYQEATDLIQVGTGSGDELQRAFGILSGIAERNPKSAHATAAFAELKYRLLGFRQSNPGEVLEIADRAVKLDPDNADAQVIYSKILLHQEQVDPAARAVERALRLAPDKPEAMFQMASVARHNEHFDEAESWYRKAIDHYANRRRKANTYYHLADMLRKREPVDVDKTIAAYDKFTELGGEPALVAYEAARLLMLHTEHYDRAIAYLTPAMSRGGDALDREAFGLLQFYKWGQSVLHPEKFRDAKEKPWDPDKITAVTGIRKEDAFALNPSVDGTPYATLAMLRLKMVKDVDAFAENCECRPENALISSVRGNHLDVAKALVAAGANVNAVERKFGGSALYYAVRFQNLDMVRFLVEHGARINMQDKYGNLIVEYAIVDAKRDDAKVLELLLANGGDANAVTSRGAPLVSIAVLNTNPAAVALLLGRYDADPNSRLSGEHGDPILALAARSAHADGVRVVRLLLDAGANPWVKAGGVDVVSSINNVKEAFAAPANAQSKFKAAEQAMAQASDAIVAMLTDARRKTPKPAGF